MGQTTMAELVDGQETTVFGRVEAAGALVEGPTGEPCVYWEKRQGLGDEPSERGGERFWVVEGDERVLVLAEALADLDARGDWAEEVVQIATSEIQAVSEELASLKDRLKQRDDPGLRRRRKKLAKVATLLCSIKAHARGKVHGKGSLEGQAAWIEKNKHLVDDGPGKATIEKAVSRLVVVLAAGDPVRVSGRFQREPMPPGLGASGGYRDRPTCWVVREAQVVGRGEAAPDVTAPKPQTEQEVDREAAARSAAARPVTPSTRSFDRKMLAAVTLMTILAAFVFYLERCR